MPLDVEAGNFDLDFYSSRIILLTHSLLWHMTCLLVSCVSSGCHATKCQNYLDFTLVFIYVFIYFALDTYGTITPIALHELRCLFSADILFSVLSLGKVRLDLRHIFLQQRPLQVVKIMQKIFLIVYSSYYQRHGILEQLTVS